MTATWGGLVWSMALLAGQAAGETSARDLGGQPAAPLEDQLLVNGDFEAEGQEGTDATPVLAWCSPLGGPAAKYDGSWYPPPGDESEPRGYNGETQNRGSVDAIGGGAVTARIMQTAQVLPDRRVALTGYMYGKSTQVVVQHHIRILDGDQNGPVLAAFVRDSTFFEDWTAFSLVALPTGGQLTVDWGFVNTSSGWNNGAVTHVDQISLTQAPDLCHDPFADTDGDGDVDQEDFAVWQTCATDTGEAGGAAAGPMSCTCLDMNADGQVDRADLAVFESCASGPEVPADVCCDGGPDCP